MAPLSRKFAHTAHRYNSIDFRVIFVGSGTQSSDDTESVCVCVNDFICICNRPHINAHSLTVRTSTVFAHKMICYCGCVEKKAHKRIGDREKMGEEVLWFGCSKNKIKLQVNGTTHFQRQPNRMMCIMSPAFESDKMPPKSLNTIVFVSPIRACIATYSLFTWDAHLNIWHFPRSFDK